jgi:hypothetical protein
MRACKIPNIPGDAVCGKFDVFEDRQARRGRKIQINIQIVPALSGRPEPILSCYWPAARGGGATA